MASSLIASIVPSINSSIPASDNKIIVFLKKHKIKVIIFLVILIVIIVLLLRKKKVSFNNEYLLDSNSSNSPLEVPEEYVIQPKYGTDSSISVNISIKDFYENLRYWRHIFHKGTEVKNLIKYDTWNDLKTDYKNQFSGLWLHPTFDKFRLCFTTEITKKYELREHPSMNALPTTYDIRPDNVLEIELEYFDIEDIPMNKRFNLTWIIEDRNIFVYIDGKLYYTFVTQGKILKNKGNYYFNYPISYQGMIENFRHIPYVISNNDVKKIAYH